MRSHAGVASRMFEALAKENINIQMISTSEIKVSVVIEEISGIGSARAAHCVRTRCPGPSGRLRHPAKGAVTRAFCCFGWCWWNFPSVRAGQYLGAGLLLSRPAGAFHVCRLVVRN